MFGFIFVAWFLSILNNQSKYNKYIWRIRLHVLKQIAKKKYNYDVEKNDALEEKIEADIADI